MLSFPSSLSINQSLENDSSAGQIVFDQGKILYDRDELINDIAKNKIPTNTKTASNIRNKEVVNNNVFYTNKFKFNTNPFKLPSSVQSNINNYKFVYDETAAIITQVGKKTKDSDNIIGEAYEIPVSPSLFNPLLSVSVKGLSFNRPLLNMFDPITNKIKPFANRTVKTAGDTTQVVEYADINYSKDTGDCSAETLCGLNDKDNKSDSNSVKDDRSGSHLAYKMSDFIYCRDYGVVPNNQMITLRKYATPVGDNVKYTVTEKGGTPDVGRLICWMGEDNKLEDILKYEYQATWREMNAEIERQDSQEDSADRGLIGSVVNMMNPAYNAGVATGRWGSGNQVYGWLSKHVGYKDIKLLSNSDPNAHLNNFVDKNRVYEPKDTVQDTHLYEGKLKFNQEFTLTFSYKLRAYDNINPKSAMLDLIANIMQVTYRKGHFWGGAHEIMGAPRNGQGWKTANAFIDNAWDKLGGFMEAMMTGNISFGDLLASVGNSLKGLVSDAEDAAKKLVDNGAAEARNKAWTAIKEMNAKTGFSNAIKGMLKTQLGRPAMYAFNSLLSGEPCGFWHVTIGNPRNPILTMGNLIIDKCSLQHCGPLGIDDFPTELKLMVTLKHGRSRDATEISKMYNAGISGLGVPITDRGDLSKYLNLKSKSIRDVYRTDNLDKLMFTFANAH